MKSTVKEVSGFDTIKYKKLVSQAKEIVEQEKIDPLLLCDIILADELSAEQAEALNKFNEKASWDLEHYTKGDALCWNIFSDYGDGDEESICWVEESDLEKDISIYGFDQHKTNDYEEDDLDYFFSEVGALLFQSIHFSTIQVAARELAKK